MRIYRTHDTHSRQAPLFLPTNSRGFQTRTAPRSQLLTLLLLRSSRALALQLCSLFGLTLTLFPVCCTLFTWLVFHSHRFSNKRKFPTDQFSKILQFSILSSASHLFYGPGFFCTALQVRAPELFGKIPQTSRLRRADCFTALAGAHTHNSSTENHWMLFTESNSI